MAKTKSIMANSTKPKIVCLIGSCRFSREFQRAAYELELEGVITVGPAFVPDVPADQHGGDVAITPDGPRGPRYKLGPGIILLAQQTGAPVVPIHVEYSRYLRAGRWDGFMIPVPFARVQVTLGPLHYVRETRDRAEFEGERLRLEQMLADAVEPC